jgi:hypothetical protein
MPCPMMTWSSRPLTINSLECSDTARALLAQAPEAERGFPRQDADLRTEAGRGRLGHLAER